MSDPLKLLTVDLTVTWILMSCGLVAWCDPRPLFQVLQKNSTICSVGTWWPWSICARRWYLFDWDLPWSMWVLLQMLVPGKRWQVRWLQLLISFDSFSFGFGIFGWEETAWRVWTSCINCRVSSQTESETYNVFRYNYNNKKGEWWHDDEHW